MTSTYTGQLILGTDKHNPLLTVYCHGEGDEEQLHFYYGLELLEIVPADPNAPSFKMLVGRFYNAGVSLRVLPIQIHRGAAKARKKVTSGNIAHYTILALRSGRRSTGTRTHDVLHPAARSNGHARVQSLDEPVGEGEDGDELTLHDCLAAPVEDPATAAGRHLDWAAVIQSLDRTARAILAALIEGRDLTLLVRPLRRSRTSLQYDKVKLGRLIQERLGPDILVQAQARPKWTSTIEAVRERLACRAERRAGYLHRSGLR